MSEIIYEQISLDRACELLKEEQKVEFNLQFRKSDCSWESWEPVIDAYHLVRILFLSNCNVKFRHVRTPMQKHIYVALDKYGNMVSSSKKDFGADFISCQKFILTEGIFDE